MSVMRKCVCCGKEYEFCPSCKKKDQPAWMVSFCSEACKGLFNIVSAYNAKRIGKVAAQAYIAEHKITEVTKYTGPVKKALEEILAKPLVKEAPKVLPAVEPIKETPKEEIVEERKEDTSKEVNSKVFEMPELTVVPVPVEVTTRPRPKRRRRR